MEYDWFDYLILINDEIPPWTHGSPILLNYEVMIWADWS